MIEAIMPFQGQESAWRMRANSIDEPTRCNVFAGFIALAHTVCRGCELGAPFNGVLWGITHPARWAEAINYRLGPKPVKSNIHSLLSFYLSEAMCLSNEKISWLQYGKSSNRTGHRVAAGTSHCANQVFLGEQTAFSTLCACIQFIGAKSRMAVDQYKIDVAMHAISQTGDEHRPLPLMPFVSGEILIQDFIREYKK